MRPWRLASTVPVVQRRRTEEDAAALVRIELHLQAVKVTTRFARGPAVEVDAGIVRRLDHIAQRTAQASETPVNGEPVPHEHGSRARRAEVSTASGATFLPDSSATKTRAASEGV